MRRASNSFNNDTIRSLKILIVQHWNSSIVRNNTIKAIKHNHRSCVTVELVLEHDERSVYGEILPWFDDNAIQATVRLVVEFASEQLHAEH